MDGLENNIAEAASAASQPALALEFGKPENYIVIHGKRFDFAEATGAKFEMNAKYNEMTIAVAFRVPAGVDTFERSREISLAIQEGAEG
jgi:hypothetical protein